MTKPGRCLNGLFDNGAPFGSNGVSGLTALSARWIGWGVASRNGACKFVATVQSGLVAAAGHTPSGLRPRSPAKAAFPSKAGEGKRPAVSSRSRPQVFRFISHSCAGSL